MILSRSVRRPWRKLSFASTLHLCPVLDLLTADLPPADRDPIRLGLQEALVNAAKHGNCLDPSKQVCVRFTTSEDCYWWVIVDQGCGFESPRCCPTITSPGGAHDGPSAVPAIADGLPDPFGLPCNDWECGRGLFILRQVFDGVQWSDCGRELRLHKFFETTEPSGHSSRTLWDGLASRLREHYDVLVG